MSTQVYSVPGQTEETREAFMEWIGIYSSSRLSLIYRSNVNYYESADHHIHNLPVRIGNTLAIFKINQ